MWGIAHLAFRRVSPSSYGTAIWTRANANSFLMFGISFRVARDDKLIGHMLPLFVRQTYRNLHIRRLLFPARRL